MFYSRNFKKETPTSYTDGVRSLTPKGEPVVPLPYRMRKHEILYSRNGYISPNAFSFHPPFAEDIAICNVAYADLVANSHERSAWVVNFLEREQALNQIASAAATMVKSLKLLKRGKLGLAAKTLGANVIPDGKYGHSKGLANAWLSLHFGWVPLTQDIFSAMETFSGDPPPLLVEGKGRSRAQWEWLDMYGSGTKWSMNSVSTQGLRQRVSNVTAFQMESLGFTNPASIAWELVPWSFLIDNYLNVSQYLNSYTDFVGLEIDRVYHNYRVTYIVERYDMRTLMEVSKYVFSERRLELWKPQLHLTMPVWPSAVRAATYMSLLTQLLPAK